ncbi:hypothetical protein PG990_013878 [Apiospora arundinis]
MVSFKTICLLGAALLGSVQAIPAVPRANTLQLSGESGTGGIEIPDLDVRGAAPFEATTDGLEKRNKPVMRLWWTPKGQFVFMAGLNFPQGIIDNLAHMTVDAPPAIMYETVANFFNPFTIGAAHQRAATLFRQATQKGGMYGSGPAQGDMGFGLVLNTFPPANDVQAMLKAIQAWAETTGNPLQIIMKPNDFMNLGGLIRNSKRINQRESAKCPKLDNIMQYVNKDVPANLDLKKLRYAGRC